MGGRVKQVKPEASAGQIKSFVKADLPPHILAGLLTKALKDYVEREISGKTKKERDKVRVKLQNDTIECLDLPEKSREKLKELLLVRIKIRDNLERGKRLGRINAEESVAVFEDLKKQLEEHGRELLEEEFETNGSDMITAAEKETVSTKRLSGTGVHAVLKAKQGGIRMNLLSAALGINSMLIQKFLSGEMEKFNQAVTIVMRGYVEKEFPASLEDVLKGV